MSENGKKNISREFYLSILRKSGGFVGWYFHCVVSQALALIVKKSSSLVITNQI